MNAVEIEEAVSQLVAEPFDAGEFPYRFLEAFGTKDTTIKRLRKGDTNHSGVPDGVLQRSNIHVATCAPGTVEDTLVALRDDPATAKGKAKFVLATDGDAFAAEELATGEVASGEYAKLHEHFGFFLPLAGITTVAEVKNNPIDIKATGRLNKLYLELLRENEDWGTDAKRPALNAFMARLIFCFFAEDTGIFHGEDAFTDTVRRMTEADGSNVPDVLSELFRAMRTKLEDRTGTEFRTWSNVFPYVNGGIFEGTTDCPRFTRTARSYLIRAGELDWRAINPDIFGSMIQAVADDEERGALGMHYTSVPNIRKVLDPLFLDDLREQLDRAGDSPRKLGLLRKRLSRIRVFDPACGSGNFLVVAYTQMREIEREVIDRRLAALKQPDAEAERRSVIRLTQFYGIEIKDFPAQIARLALLIAEFQCDARLVSERFAQMSVLPLHRTGHIVVGNALRLDWAEVCPPVKGVRQAADLGGPTGELPFEDDGVEWEEGEAETYICGNPPYKGRNKQDQDQKDDIRYATSQLAGKFSSIDYVGCWFIKSSLYARLSSAKSAFVATKSICQGEQVAILWPTIYGLGMDIAFARRPFEWSNLASDKAGVTVSVIGFDAKNDERRFIFDDSNVIECNSISPYLVPGDRLTVHKSKMPMNGASQMHLGNMAKDGGHLILTRDESEQIRIEAPQSAQFLRRFWGAEELVKGVSRYCIWISDEDSVYAATIPSLSLVLEKVSRSRLMSKAPSTQKYAEQPHRFVQRTKASGECAIVVPKVTSGNRNFITCDVLQGTDIVSDKCYSIYTDELWHYALISSTSHRVWIDTVCSKLRNDYSYGNTLGWNTFPVPKLTAKNKDDLTRCAEAILLAREAYFPATIADMYDPDRMDAEFPEVRAAHEANDEMLERIYIGRRFKNDTERLEHLFDRYAKMTAADASKKAGAA